MDADAVITVCTGHRCQALLEGSSRGAMPLLRSAVRNSSQAVLLATDCVGACAQAPVVAVSHGRCEDGRVEAEHTAWLGPVNRKQVWALCGWVAAQQPLPLPAPLIDAVFARS